MKPTETELRRLIVKACGALHEKNLVAATDGNVSARLSSDRILMTPKDISKGDVRAADVVLCDLAGRKIRGRGEITSEVKVHLAAYRARPDIGGVVHAHPPIATAFTFAGLEQWLREPVVPDVVARIGPIPAAPYLTPGSQALADAAEPLFTECDIVLLTRHGAVSVGADPWAAFLRMAKLEQLALTLKTARELAGPRGSVRRLDAAQVRELRRSYAGGRRR